MICERCGHLELAEVYDDMYYRTVNGKLIKHHNYNKIIGYECPECGWRFPKE